MSEICCRKTKAGLRTKWAGLILPGAAFFVMPKCPMCLAAYIALATGLSVSVPFAAGLRTAMVVFATGACFYFSLRIYQHLKFQKSP
ncbi:MAG: hypothetical protein H7Y36_01525 [Armatimonadetes bacterium]|nr:hypothetical protein [Akkermansiaceae bacterium]